MDDRRRDSDDPLGLGEGVLAFLKCRGNVSELDGVALLQKARELRQRKGEIAQTSQCRESLVRRRLEPVEAIARPEILAHCIVHSIEELGKARSLEQTRVTNFVE